MAAPGSPSFAVLRVSDGGVLSCDSKATLWRLRPGSTAKPFAVEALLDGHKLRADETYLCPGELHIGQRNFTCSHLSGLPPMNASRAIAYSCNCAVAHFAERFAPGELATALRREGLEAQTGDTRLEALGEEGVLVTPMQLAKAYARLAQRANPAVLQGLEAAVRYGTAQGAALPNLQVAGKTGSAMTTAGLHTAWFAGFAPSRSPEIVVVVAIQGRSGGADAAPIAADLLRKHLGARYRVRVGRDILDLPVEQYVAAVLAGEGSVFRNGEALKAIAVAARTYAAHERGRHAKEGFDFCNTTHCQRAEPTGVTPQLTAVARATANELLRYRGEVAFTPYTMSCGGMAESVTAVWPDINAPYLRVHTDNYCAPVTWSRHIQISSIERALRDAGLTCPARLTNVSVLNRTASGRARQLLLQGDSAVIISAGAFRFAIGRDLGWDNIRSDWFDLSGDLDIHGKGEGHGVGLCQNGADRMAADGHSYREILAFYYPHASTTNWVQVGGEGVVVYTPDPTRDVIVLREAERLLKTLPWPVNRSTDIYVYSTVEDFRNATNEPGWVAAHTDGQTIHLQPVRILQQRGILTTTLHNELLHVAMESRAHRDLPVWFREGLVDWLSGERAQGSVSQAYDQDIQQRYDRGRAERGYRTAEASIAGLVASYGEPTVLSWVTAGLPDAVTNSSARIANTKSK